MEVLNWMAEHWVLTIVLFVIVFGNLGHAHRWRRSQKHWQRL
jgi:hypothetical protein